MMKSLTPSMKATTIIMRILSVLVLIYVIAENSHLFDSSSEKGFLFYYLLVIGIGFLISAFGMWKLTKWSVIVFLALSLALIPGFVCLNACDLKSIAMFVIVLIAGLINWKNLK